MQFWKILHPVSRWRDFLEWQPMDLDLFLELLKIDSTSGREGELADYIIEHLDLCGGRLEVFPASEGKNILISWGDPQIVFCTHYDTVPPYIAPTVENIIGL